MTTFAYVATDVNGKKVKGTEMAEDSVELIDKLRQKGLFCTSYKDAAKNKAADVKYKFKTKDLSFFCRQLAAMLTSGVSLVKALQILQAQTENKKQKQVLLDIYEEVQKGRSFSEAIATKPGVFPSLFVSMVGAGEASGNLDVIMNRVSEHYAKDSKTQNKIKGAMIYPIVLLVLLLVIMIAMFTMIMPMFRDLAGDTEMPPLSQAIFGISDFMINQGYILVIVLIAIIIVLRLIIKTPSSKLKWDEMLLKLPKVGGLLRTIYTARFARTMSNLFSSGLQMVDDTGDNVESMSAGKYYLKKGKHYILYEDMDDENDEITKNTIKFNSETVEVTRKGLVTGKLVFKKGKNNQSLYSTPFGDLLMEVYTKDILLEEKEDNIDLKIDYELYANNSKVSDSIININIRQTV